MHHEVLTGFRFIDAGISLFAFVEKAGSLSNPIKVGRLFCKGPGSANRKHFSHIKRMTITRRGNITKTEAGHQPCAAVITHIQPITPELDLLAVVGSFSMDTKVLDCK